MRILLVEDNPYIQEFIIFVLRREGHEVEALENGDVALGVYKGRKSPYDLVLTDMGHPGMDGVELAASIRLIDPSQCIALQTGCADGIAAELIKTHGVSGIPRIGKPFSAEQLLRFVGSVLASAQKS